MGIPDDPFLATLARHGLRYDFLPRAEYPFALYRLDATGRVAGRVFLATREERYQVALKALARIEATPADAKLLVVRDRVPRAVRPTPRLVLDDADGYRRYLSKRENARVRAENVRRRAALVDK